MQREFVIKNKSGLHARPAAKFVALAKKFPETITVVKGEKAAAATSLLGILGLGISCGETVYLRVEGERAEQVLNEVAEFLESLAYEDEI